MDLDTLQYAHTSGMDDNTLKQHLRNAEAGVLALASGNDAYAVPLAHYYDGTHLYFRVGWTDDSHLRAFVGTTETACYTLYETEPTAEARELDSWSIIVTGELRNATASERERFDDAEINRHFAPIRVFDEDIDEIEISILVLDIESITGRETLR